MRFDQRLTSQLRCRSVNGIAPQHDANSLSPIGRPSQCHHAVTHNLAKLTEQLFVAGTMVSGLASNCSTLELLNVRNADRLSARTLCDQIGELRATPGACRRSELFSRYRGMRVMRQTTSKAAAGSSANRRQVLSLAAGIALLAGVTTAHAQSTGIAPCDDFLTKYDACIVSKVPEAQRAMYKTQIDQTRKAWVDMAKNPSDEGDHGSDLQADPGCDEGLARGAWLLVLTAPAKGERRRSGRGAPPELWPKRRVHRRRTISRSSARLQGAVCKPLTMPINHLLTITPQHCPSIESPRALV